MGKIFHIVDEYDERTSEETMLEKAFKEGCEHGYKKAMRELENYDERKTSRISHREGFEEKIAKLKEKYK